MLSILQTAASQTCHEDISHKKHIEMDPHTVREKVSHHVQVMQSVAMEVFQDEEL